jgi:hypothetical protein
MVGSRFHMASAGSTGDSNAPGLSRWLYMRFSLKEVIASSECAETT